MSLVPFILNLLFSNVWRTIALFITVVCVGLVVTVCVYQLRLIEANINLNEEKAKLNKIVVDSMVFKQNMKIATDALTKEKDKQVAEAKRLAELLKDFPKDCEGAAQRAADILIERNK